MYDISGQITLDRKLTKAVCRERLIKNLETLNAAVTLSEDDGAVEFKPAPRNRGKHPLKNITLGRISLSTGRPNHPYISQITFQLSLIQMRISLVTICLVLWAYSLLRQYDFMIPITFTLLTWLFGYGITILFIRSRFRNFLEATVR